jgi:hypothetical protein
MLHSVEDDASHMTRTERWKQVLDMNHVPSREPKTAMTTVTPASQGSMRSSGMWPRKSEKETNQIAWHT